MRRLIENHKEFWQKTELAVSATIGVLFLLISLIVNYYAGNYATIRASNSVTDLILDNIPTINTEIIFVEGIFIFLMFIAWLLIKEPKRIPFTLKSIALFVIIRSVFIILTHIGPSPDPTPIISGNFIGKFTFGGDLFFSGHTGLPFLMALIFWQNKRLRIGFIIAAIFFGAAVLLGHLHYSIDVFAAFFITDGIFRISEKMFRKDYELLSSTFKSESAIHSHIAA